MLLVDHYVAPSRVHGLGVYSRSFLPAGAIVWSFHPFIDREISVLECDDLPDHVVKLIKDYAEYLPERNMFRLSADGARFMNHSDQPNLRDEGDAMFAARDIYAGEELFCDYRITRVMAFDPDHVLREELEHRSP